MVTEEEAERWRENLTMALVDTNNPYGTAMHCAIANHSKLMITQLLSDPTYEALLVNENAQDVNPYQYARRRHAASLKYFLENKLKKHGFLDYLEQERDKSRW